MKLHTTRWLLLSLAIALVACQGPPSRPAQRTPNLAALAAEAVEMGQYARAAELYRRALEASPESLALHYGLAIAASHLDLKDETVREFRWVLERGEAGSQEVEVARRWLASVGALPRPASRAESEMKRTGNTKPEEEWKPELASVGGRALSGQTTADARAMGRLRLYLIGQPDRVNYYTLRTDEEGRFRFRNVAPGTYMLTNSIGGEPLWRLRVEIKPRQHTVLDLTPANGFKVLDDSPSQP